MKLGLMDLIYELRVFELFCFIKHKYHKINYRGSIREVCGHCSKFKTGGYFR